MIQHVYERARRARLVDRVLVATDDERILRRVQAFGGEAVMTSPRHATGTDRLAEAVQATDARIVVNVQGDEPMLDPAAIDAVVEPMAADAAREMTTLSLPLTNLDEMMSASVVKVVTDSGGMALYFSRSPIPFFRSPATNDIREAAREAVRRGLARKHVGLYAYRRATLLRLAALPPSPLEEAEGLEQLRALQHGTRIHVVSMNGEGAQAVDTPEDLERVRLLLLGMR